MTNFASMGTCTPGRTFFNVAIARARCRSESTRNLTDSGSMAMRKTATTIGRTPPTQNKACHPKRGTSKMDTRPGSEAPNVLPPNIRITMVARKRFGEYSLLSATAFGMTPPMPMPARKRMTNSSGTDVAAVAIRVKIPNIRHDETSASFRPNRSPRYPNNNDPTRMPTRLALNTGASAAGDRCQSRTRCGAAKPTAMMSYPSSSITMNK